MKNLTRKIRVAVWQQVSDRVRNQVSRTTWPSVYFKVGSPYECGGTNPNIIQIKNQIMNKTELMS